MKAAELLVECLKQERVNKVAGYSGRPILSKATVELQNTCRFWPQTYDRSFSSDPRRVRPPAVSRSC